MKEWERALLGGFEDSCKPGKEVIWPPLGGQTCATRPTGLDLNGQPHPCLTLRGVGRGTHPDQCPRSGPHGQTHSLPTPCHPAMLDKMQALWTQREPPGTQSHLPSQGFEEEARGCLSFFSWVFLFFGFFLFFVFALSLTFAKHDGDEERLLPQTHLWFWAVNVTHALE